MQKNALDGLKNEEDIINHLNNKTFEELDEKWAKHIKEMFPFIKEKDFIYAEKYENHQGKPDAVLSVRHTKHYLSIKSGRNPSVHQENFFAFQRYLKAIGVPTRINKILFFFHFGESKKLNNAGNPLSKEELEEKYSDYFKEASAFLSKPKIAESLIYRSIIKGANSKRKALTYLYYGNVNQGFLLSAEDIYSLVLNNGSNSKSPIHFCGLNYQPGGRKRTSQDYRYVRIKLPILSPLFYLSENELREVIDGTKQI